MYTKSMWSRTSLQYTSSYREWMQTMPFCMRKHQSVSETCNSCRVREWVRVIVKVARLCWLFVNAFFYCLARTMSADQVRTKDDELLKRVLDHLNQMLVQRCFPVTILSNHRAKSLCVHGLTFNLCLGRWIYMLYLSSHALLPMICVHS